MRPHPPREYSLTVHQRDDPPLHADWSWSAGPFLTVPDASSGAAVAPGVALFHDEPTARLAVAGEGARLVVRPGDFRGDFISLAIDLPPAIARTLATHHLVAAAWAPIGPPPGTARLNLRVGPDQITRLSPVAPCESRVAVDLDRAVPEGQTPDHAWLDLIWDAPRTAELGLAGLRLARVPRAAM